MLYQQLKVTQPHTHCHPLTSVHSRCIDMRIRGSAIRNTALRVFVATANIQLLAPNTDVSAGGWTPSTGGTLYGCIDETAADSADYILSSTETTCEVSFPSGGTGSAAGGYVRYRLLPGAGKVTVSLKQGATTLHTWGPHTLLGNYQDFTQLITATTSNSDNLRLTFTASKP